MRDYRFDVARVVCMTYIVAFMHLYGYVYPQGREAFYIPVCVTMTDACLGLFTFVSGYLLGSKYLFGKEGNTSLWIFYKKRIIRIIPLFILASVALWLIEFNSDIATINGLLCISPFVNPKPRTLWYIPVILWCYLLTPLISRKSLKWRIYSSILLMTSLVVARFLFPSVDGRLLFNLFFYLVGIISASCFDWRFKMPYGKAVKVASILLFVVLIMLCLHHSLLYRPSMIMAIGGIGVFVILFVCEGISTCVFSGQDSNKNLLSLIVGFVSYASMACYMFHRPIYWLAQEIWNPSDTTVKWWFMAGIVFPVIVMISYVIQKGYDSLVKRI